MSPRVLLLPVAVLYWIGTSLRSWLYDVGIMRSRSFDKPVICVGNITVGGTGKTPVIEHIVSRLTDEGFSVAVVSRGYRRRTKGQVIATGESTAEEVGDEPRQIKKHYPRVDVVVDADRGAAIDTAIGRGADVVLMDDGMQHRSVNPSVLILVCDYARPLWRDLPLPAGNKRESMYARLRADVVIINKCPRELTRAQAEGIYARLSLNDGQRIFFTSVVYGELMDAEDHIVTDTLLNTLGAVVVAGIGRPGPFFAEVQRRFTAHELRMLAYDDHHAYSAHELSKIEGMLDAEGQNSYLVTTEKDAARLPRKVGRHVVLRLPIKLEVLFGEGEKFDQLVCSMSR